MSNNNMPKGNVPLTPYLNQNNIENVRRMIARKQMSTPYISTVQEASSILTDMDHHPYGRYYRGVPEYSEPIFFEREAGWRIVNNECYSGEPQFSKEYALPPVHCFQVPCSTVLPCHCESTSQYSKR